MFSSLGQHTVRTVDIAQPAELTVKFFYSSPFNVPFFFKQMDDINVLHHRCLLNLRRRIRDIGDGRPAQERYMRLQKDGDTLRSASGLELK